MNFNKQKQLFLLVIVFICLTTFSQESKTKINKEGKKFSELKHAWTAQWITHPFESTLDSRVFLFRRNFNLKEKPKTFVVHVSADNRYRLYVNGIYIVSGPSSSDINNYRYETLDLSAYLKEGKNTISAEVVNFGEYRKASSMTFQTAFILQGSAANPVNVNTGSTSKWKVVRNFGFESIPFVSDSLRGYYAFGPGEKRIIRNYLKNWNKINFDDSKWLKPKAGTVEFAVGKGFLFGSTWYLVPRKIPFMEERKQRFGAVVRMEGIPFSDHFIKGKGGLEIPKNKNVKILIDQKHHTIGHPELFYSKGEGSEIKITYSEALYDFNWKKGHRNVVENKRILGYYDRIEADGSINNRFKPYGQKTYRFIELEIKTANEPLIINDYYGV